MSQDFSGKQIVVTGATRGIGEACARRFAALGGQVALVGRDQARLDKLLAELPNDPIAIRADLGTEEGVETVVGRTLQDFGGLDVLVNNAGATFNEPAHKLQPESVDSVLAINVKGLMLLTSRFAKPLFQRQGNVVNVSSIAARGGEFTQAGYVASKGAVNSLTINLAREWGSKGVRVNCIAPGPINTEMWAPAFELLGEKEAREQFEAAVPLGRWGEPEEIATVACFLASDEASYISGETITVDGAMR